MTPARSLPTRRLVALAAFLLASAMTAQAQSIDDLQDAAVQANRANQVPRAIELTMQQLQATEQQFGSSSLESALVVDRLAWYERQDGRYEASARSYEREIEILQRLPDQGGDEYVNALVKVGMLHLDSGHPERAELPLRRALDWGDRKSVV